MKIHNSPILCPYCGCLSAYLEIDRISTLREKAFSEGAGPGWEVLLKSHKKKEFCLMCHQTIALTEGLQ